MQTSNMSTPYSVSEAGILHFFHAADASSHNIYLSGPLIYHGLLVASLTVGGEDLAIYDEDANGNSNGLIDYIAGNLPGGVFHLVPAAGIYCQYGVHLKGSNAPRPDFLIYYRLIGNYR